MNEEELFEMEMLEDRNDWYLKNLQDNIECLKTELLVAKLNKESKETIDIIYEDIAVIKYLIKKHLETKK